ncbi:MAG: hypothetical protein JO038_04630 [Alphaproteobacteria bacterium]|nr:hypothetical protein [Alphaproteobacteria bacterium]
MEGALAFYGPGDNDWSAGQVNLPVAEGGWFATAPQSRAQFQIGPDTVDLDASTQLNFATLRNAFMQAAVTQGRISLDLRQRPTHSETDEVDVARGGVWLDRPGIYDIDSGDADRPTRITVFEGRAHFVGAGVDRTIRKGEQLAVSGSDTLTAELHPASPDAFDEWCRRHEPRQPRIAERVSPAMTGVDDLAAYGAWNNVPQYGAVWFPQAVPADWAPYRDGHWVWIEPWGWNWVDHEPWGFAPFHYGRWIRLGYRWAWVPGEYVPEPVYAPALVAYIPPPAIEAVVSFDDPDAGPPIGWFPLAPGEVYWPTYTRDPGYFRNVNVTSVSVTKITNITAVIVNQPAAGPPPQVAQQAFANRGAATVVPARTFIGSAPVAAAAVKVAPAVLQKASVAVAPPSAIAAPVAAAAAKAPAAAPKTNAPAAPAPATGMPGAVAKATPANPPAAPVFSKLAPAPRVSETATAAKTPAPEPIHPPPGAQANRPPIAQPEKSAPPLAATAPVPPSAKTSEAPGSAAPAAVPPTAAGGKPPNAPDFSHLAPTKLPAKAPAVVAPPKHPSAPAAADREQPAPGNPVGRAAVPTPATTPGPPNVGHLAPEHAGPRAAPPAPGPGAAAGTAPQPPAVSPHRPTPQEPSAAVSHEKAAPEASRAAEQRAIEDQAKQHAAQEAQQRAAAQAAQQHAAQEAQQRATAQAAQQHAAQEAQQRATAQAAQQHAAQEAQQRAAAQAAQQRAAQEAQQRAAAQAAQQHAAQEAQQRAAAQAVQQHGAKQAQHAEPACGQPGLPACPK